MGGTTKKNPKTKPAKLTEFFNTSSQSSDPKKELMFPTSPTPSSRPESVDFDQPEASGSNTSTEYTLQKLFHSFREDLQVDFRRMMQDFKTDIQTLVTRTEHIESKMAEFATSHNTLIDSHNALEEEVHRLSNKVLDLEDRSRRNNIRLRGIPESVSPDQLNPFLTDLLALAMPHRSSQDLLIDRIHRLPKPRHLPSHVSRDTIARINFFAVKEEFLKILRSQPELPERFQNLSIYPDLSAATMLKRKEFSVYTKILRDAGISYKWGFPVKLIVFKDGSPAVCPDPDTAKEALISWNLIPPQDTSPKRKNPPRPEIITPLWSDRSRRARCKDPD